MAAATSRRIEDFFRPVSSVTADRGGRRVGGALAPAPPAFVKKDKAQALVYAVAQGEKRRRSSSSRLTAFDVRQQTLTRDVGVERKTVPTIAAAETLRKQRQQTSAVEGVSSEANMVGGEFGALIGEVDPVLRAAAADRDTIEKRMDVGARLCADQMRVVSARVAQLADVEKRSAMFPMPIIWRVAAFVSEQTESRGKVFVTLRIAEMCPDSLSPPHSSSSSLPHVDNKSATSSATESGAVVEVPSESRVTPHITVTCPLHVWEVVVRQTHALHDKQYYYSPSVGDRSDLKTDTASAETLVSSSAPHRCCIYGNISFTNRLQIIRMRPIQTDACARFFSFREVSRIDDANISSRDHDRPIVAPHGKMAWSWSDALEHVKTREEGKKEVAKSKTGSVNKQKLYDLVVAHLKTRTADAYSSLDISRNLSGAIGLLGATSKDVFDVLLDAETKGVLTSQYDTDGGQRLFSACVL